MKPLTNKEKKVFSRIDNPIVSSGKRFGRPVVVTYYCGRVVGIDTVTAWRRYVKNYGISDECTYELRLLWT